MSSSERRDAGRSPSKKEKAVNRTPSKLYRKIVADEVASSDCFSFANEGEVSPVKLLSVKHKGYINPFLLDYLPGSCVDPGPDCGVTYHFPSTEPGSFDSKEDQGGAVSYTMAAENGQKYFNNEDSFEATDGGERIIATTTVTVEKEFAGSLPESEQNHHELNESYSSEDTIQEKGDQNVTKVVTESKEEYRSQHLSTDVQRSPNQLQPDLSSLSDSYQDHSRTSETSDFSICDIQTELDKCTQENTTHVQCIPGSDLMPEATPKKQDITQEVPVTDYFEKVAQPKQSHQLNLVQSPEQFRDSQQIAEELEGIKEETYKDGQAQPEPIVLSEQKTSEASERETTRSETHGHLDTKITENVSEQKEQASRTELTHDGIRVVKEESVEAVKVVRETSVTEKQVRTVDGEFKPFSDEPFQALLKSYASHEESVREGGYNEAAVDVEVSKPAEVIKPDLIPPENIEKPVKVEVVEAPPPSDNEDEDLGMEVKVAESGEDITEKEEGSDDHSTHSEHDDSAIQHGSPPVSEKEKKSPKSGLFSFFKKKSDKDKNHVGEDEEKIEKSAKEKKKEERERKEREKREREREEKEKKQREKEEKERKKKEEREKRKSKGKLKDKQKHSDNADVSPVTTPTSPESVDLNKSFTSGTTNPESESHSIQEEPISPSAVEKAPQEIPIHFMESSTSESGKPPSDTAPVSEEQDNLDTTLEEEQSYPIETDVVVKAEKRAHTLSVSSDHREEIMQVDEPKSFTLPRANKPGKDETVAEPFIRVTPQPSTSQMLAPLHSPNSSFDSAIDTSNSDPTRAPGHFVVVAIDFGTTFSGYAFSFTRDPESIHMMRKWEGGDPGVINQKTPTTLLLYPDGSLHSFGYTARDRYHDLDPQEAKKWLYFEKFKMVLHYNADLNKETTIKAANGKEMPALTIFSHALKFFRDHALQELSDQSSIKILNEDVKWVITVPAIWKAPAKQFMRTAAYNAGIASQEYPDQLLIALEPEAASIYVRRLRMHQLVPEKPERRPLSPRKEEMPYPMNMDRVSDEFRDVEFIEIEPITPRSPSAPNSPSIYPLNARDTVGSEVNFPGTRYMIVDCGGGTVDITVHEMDARGGKLKELYKATGGPYGSVGVDIEFEKLLVDIFGADFIEAFKVKRPVGWVDLMIAFESRKRAANPFKPNPLNVALPFSFIDYYKKFRGSQVDSAIKKYKDPNIRWSTQGMLRLNPEAMKKLFAPTVENIKVSIGDVLNNPSVKDVKYIFLVGGFAESPILQQEIRNEFGHLVKMIIPQDVTLTILKGAVLFGLDPTIVNVRRSRMTYGVGVLNRFIHGKHPAGKLVQKDGIEWCTDVFDKFVVNDQPVALGDTVLRSYTPAKPGQKSSVINIYCSEINDQCYITDKGVKKCGTLCLDLTDMQYQENLPKRREIQTRMIFGDTEIKISALDVTTGKCVRAAIDFLT